MTSMDSDAVPELLPISGNSEQDQEAAACLKRALEKREAEEAVWKSHGWQVRWLSQPDYIGPGLWDLPLWRDDWWDRKPGREVFRFSLIGGGQMKITKEWKRYNVGNGETQVFAEKDRIELTAHCGDRVQFANMILEEVYTDDGLACKCLLHRRAAPELVERAVKMFETFYDDDDAVFALLDSSQGCALCHRPLRDEVSKLVGVGPDCASQHGIPHNLEAASRRLALRKKLLGEDHGHA